MKTRYAKTLITIIPLLTIGFAAGCQQQEGPIHVATTEDVDNRNLAGEDQLPNTTAKSTDEHSDQNETAESEADVDSNLESNVELPATPHEVAEAAAEPTIDIPATWTRLSKTQEVWVDLKNKQVIVGGKVCLNAGPLEMLICPQNTKEHESIVSVNAESWQVDAALIAAGAEKGVPCRWAPEYTQAWGSKIDLKMIWRDEKSNEVKTIDGKQWILNADTRKPMTTELVFGGSYSAPQLEGEQPRYQADDGELICLANFSTSTIDLSVSEENVDIFFEANTPLIPPLNTQVYAVIIPGPVVGKPEE